MSSSFLRNRRLKGVTSSSSSSSMKSMHCSSDKIVAGVRTVVRSEFEDLTLVKCFSFDLTIKIPTPTPIPISTPTPLHTGLQAAMKGLRGD